MLFGLRLGLPSKKAAVEPPPRSEVLTKGGNSRNALTVNEFVARTKRSREKGLEPTKPELISYAKYLGIDPVIDGDLMWISDEALKAPLPSEWTEHHDSNERIFYYNVQTRESSWTHPLEQLHRDMYRSIVNFRGGHLTKEEQASELEKLRSKCEQTEKEAHQELQSWTEHTDDQGQKFYYNKDTKRSVWTDPRPARCHSLYLQMKALRVLSQHCGQSSSPRAEHSIDLLKPPKPNSIHDDTSTTTTTPRSPRSNRGEVQRVPSTEPEKERKRGKGKKQRNESKSKDRGNSLCPSSADEGEQPLKRSGELRRPNEHSKRPSFKVQEMRGPGLSAAEEARHALAASNSLPMLNSARLQSPTGDGLSTVGRAKVRAGIRLEPLQGGA